MRIEIQRRLEKAEGKIHVWQEEVNVYEHEVSHEERLAQLRKGTIIFIVFVTL